MEQTDTCNAWAGALRIMHSHLDSCFLTPSLPPRGGATAARAAWQESRLRTLGLRGDRLETWQTFAGVALWLLIMLLLLVLSKNRTCRHIYRAVLRSRVADGGRPRRTRPLGRGGFRDPGGAHAANRLNPCPMASLSPDRSAGSPRPRIMFHVLTRSPFIALPSPCVVPRQQTDLERDGGRRVVQGAGTLEQSQKRVAGAGRLSATEKTALAPKGRWSRAGCDQGGRVIPTGAWCPGQLSAPGSPGANCPVGTGPLGGAELFAAPALSCTTPRAGTRRPDFSAGEPPRADGAKRPPASPGALISVHHHQPPNISCPSQPPRQTTSSPSRKPTTASQPAFRRPLKENPPSGPARFVFCILILRCECGFLLPSFFSQPRSVECRC